MEKVKWNSIDKKQNGFKYSNNDKSSTLPQGVYITKLKTYVSYLILWNDFIYIIKYE